MKRMVWELGEIVIGEGDRRKARVEEIDEYHYLRVIISARGRIYA